MTTEKTIAAVVVNDKGQILPYTVQSSMEQCEEAATEFWGADTWERIKALGGRVAQCEIHLCSPAMRDANKP